MPPARLELVAEAAGTGPPASDGALTHFLMLCAERLSGRRHQVITAVAALLLGADTRVRTVTTRVAFKRLSAAEVECYLACGEGIGKAGGYAIQGRAEIFVQFPERLLVECGRSAVVRDGWSSCWLAGYAL